MRAVRAENEFELKENRIDVTIGQEEILLQKIVIVLQPELGELGRIPSEIARNARATLPRIVIGKSRVLHVQVIAAHTGHPAFFESPKNLRIHSPVVKRLRDRKRLVDSAASFEAAIHRFGLPFHEREATLGVRAFPFVEKIGAINLRARIRAGFIRTERAGNSREHNLRGTQINGIFPTRNPDKILQAARLAIGRAPAEEHSIITGITE